VPGTSAATRVEVLRDRLSGEIFEFAVEVDPNQGDSQLGDGVLRMPLGNERSADFREGPRTILEHDPSRFAGIDSRQAARQLADPA
jgi:hypothetical protein